MTDRSTPRAPRATPRASTLDDALARAARGAAAHAGAALPGGTVPGTTPDPDGTEADAVADALAATMTTGGIAPVPVPATMKPVGMRKGEPVLRVALFLTAAQRARLYAQIDASRHERITEYVVEALRLDG